MNTGIPRKCKYYHQSLSILLIFYALIPLIFFAGTWESNDNIQILLVCMDICCDVTINLLLLYFYIKGLHIFSINHYFEIDSNDKYPINDRQHELMLEATRYTVLFGISAIVNVIGFFVFGGIILYIYGIMMQSDDIKETSWSYILWMLLEIYFWIRHSVMLTSIHLSFIFSHRKYESKYCCYHCDKWMKSKCHKIAIEANKNETIKRKLQYEQVLLPNNGNIHKL